MLIFKSIPDFSMILLILFFRLIEPSILYIEGGGEHEIITARKVNIIRLK